MRQKSIAVVFAAALGVFSLVVGVVLHTPEAPGAHFADADDAVTVKHGKSVYMGHCASCHGRNLQGQPLWQLRDEFAARRAPAHDETGHTWQHSDEEIFHMTKYGRFASSPVGVVSFMPAFGDVLGDRDIIAVMAFIKARWPISLRVLQATLNPRSAGMPHQADRAEWTFPPTTCNAALRQKAAAVSTIPAVAGTASAR
jgi:S-disulfanyl-L-cysteine oxidoreductase SoxD